MKDWKKLGGVLPIILTLALVACGESPREPAAAALMEGFEPGASITEVVNALPPGTITSSDPQEAPSILAGYWRDQYLVDGNFVEVLWLHDPAGGVPSGDFRETHIPVVFMDSELIGWGWEDFDSRQGDLNLSDRSTASGAMR